MKDGEEYFSGRVSLKAVIASPQGVLVQRNGSDREFWDLPGGTLHAGEKPEDALVREVQEELAIDIELGQPLVADSFIKRGNQNVVIIYAAKQKDPMQPIVLEEGEVTEYRWVTQEQLGEVKLYPEYHKVVEAFFR